MLENAFSIVLVMVHRGHNLLQSLIIFNLLNFSSTATLREHRWWKWKWRRQLIDGIVFIACRASGLCWKFCSTPLLWRDSAWRKSTVGATLCRLPLFSAVSSPFALPSHMYLRHLFWYVDKLVQVFLIGEFLMTLWKVSDARCKYKSTALRP